MSLLDKSELKAALRDAVSAAITAVGIDAFKQTSFFGSNDPAFAVAKSVESFKKAA